MHGQKHWKYVEFGSDIMKDKYRVNRNQERLKKWNNAKYKLKEFEKMNKEQEKEDEELLKLIEASKGKNWIKFWWDWI